MAKCAQMRCSFQRFIDWQIGARYLLLNTMSNGHQTVERSIKDEQGPSPWRGVGGRSLYPSSGWKNSFNGRQTTSSWTAIHPAPLFRGVGGVLMKQMVGSCYHVLRSPLGEQIDFRNKFPSFGFFFFFHFQIDRRHGTEASLIAPKFFCCFVSRLLIRCLHWPSQFEFLVKFILKWLVLNLSCYLSSFRFLNFCLKASQVRG